MITHQCSRLCVDSVEILDSETRFPKDIQLVVRLPGCDVMSNPSCPSFVYRVMVNVDWGWTVNSTGSETMSAPSGIEKLWFPLKVRGLSVFVSIALAPGVPSSGSATVAAVMFRLFGPNAFENRTRIWSPPILVWIVCLIVESAKTPSVPF